MEICCLFPKERSSILTADNYYRYLPTNQSLESRNWYLAALEKDGRLAVTPCQDPENDSSFQSGSFFISRKLKNLYNPVQENVIMVNLNTAFLDTLFSALDASTFPASSFDQMIRDSFSIPAMDSAF